MCQMIYGPAPIRGDIQQSLNYNVKYGGMHYNT